MEITVNVDWLDEISADAFLKKEVLKSVIAAIEPDIKERIVKEAHRQLSDGIDDFIGSMLEAFFEREIVITDNWGDIKKRFKNVDEMLKEKFDNFLTESVDEHGKKHEGSGGCYGKQQPRISWLLDERVMKRAEAITKEIVKQVDAKITNTLQAALKEQLGEKLMEKIDIAHMIKTVKTKY